MDYSDLTFVDVQVRDGVAAVSLNNPGRNNAYSRTGHAEMCSIMGRLARDPNVCSVLLTGAGDAFSAGPLLDPAAPLAVGPTAQVSSTMEEVRELVYGAIECDKPVACAINGVVRGSALTFALLADVIVIERHVTLADTHVLVALTAGDGGTLTWPLSIGLIRAKRYLLTGDPMSAEDAQRLGLVTEMVEQGQSKTRARRYAERWARGPQTALRTTKRALNQWLRLGASTAFELSLASELLTLKSEEAAQAVERFMRGDGAAIERDQP